MKVLDSHVHFVDIDRADGVVWPLPDSPIYRSWNTADLESDLEPVELQACVAIETSRRLPDDHWLADLAMQSPLIAGVVLNLQPDLPGFAARLKRFAKREKFVGVRFRPIDDYDLNGDQLRRSIRQLSERGKCIEFGARTADQKAAFARLAADFPSSTWILDHSGHPTLEADAGCDWRRGIELIARLPNTACKVTGSTVLGDEWATVRTHLFNCFGPDRLMFGSNWPASPVSDNTAAMLSAASWMPGCETTKFYFSNAVRLYGLPEQLSAQANGQQGH